MNTEKGKAVVMFSGGGDSFLTAVRAVVEGYSVELLTFDNGCMSGLENIEYTGNLLVDTYHDSVSPVKIVKTAAVRMLLSKWYDTHTLDEIAKYHKLQPYQLNCLHCHTAMYVKAIEYCLANGVGTLFNGARQCQGFIVENDTFVYCIYSSLVEKYGLMVDYPVWDMRYDTERLLELADRGFTSSLYEGQCWIGSPVCSTISDNDVIDYVRYFNDVLLPVCTEYLDNRDTVFTQYKY